MHIVWKITKGILFFLLGLVLLLFVAGFFIEPVAKRMLLKEVNQAGEGQYSLRLDDLSISLLRGNFRLNGIRFQTDTAGEQVAPVIFAEAGELSAEGVSWLSYFTSKRLSIDRISLSDLTLRLKVRSTGSRAGKEPFQLSQLDIYPKIKNKLNKASLEDLSLQNIDFALIDIQSKDTLRFTAAKLELKSQDILLDAEKLFTEDRTFYAEEIDLNGEQLKALRSGNRSWQGQTDKLQLASRGNKMDFGVEGFSFLLSGEAVDTLWFASLPELSLEGLNLQRLQEEEVAELTKISLLQPTIFTAAIQKDSKNTSKAEEAEKENASFKVSEISLGKYLPGFIRKVEVGEVELESLSYQQKERFHLQNFDLAAADILVDKGSAFKENRLLHAKTIQSNFDSLLLTTVLPDHRLEVAEFSLHTEEGEGTLSLNQLTLHPQQPGGKELRMKGNIAAVKLSSFNVQELAAGKLALGRLSLQAPAFSLQLPPSQQTASSAGTDFSVPDLYKYLDGALKELRFEGVEVQKGSLRLARQGRSQETLLVPDFALQLEDVLISESGAFEGERVLHSKDIRLQLNQLHYNLPESPYALEIARAWLGTALQTFSLQGVNYQVKASHKDMLDKPSVEQSYDFSNQLLKLEGIDYQRLLQSNFLYAERLTTSRTNLQIFGEPFSTGNDSKENGNINQPTQPSDTSSQQLALASVNLAEKLPQFLKGVRIGDVDLQQIDVLKMKEFRIENLHLQASDLLLKAEPAFAADRFFHALELQTGFDSLWIKTDSPAHYLQVRGFSFGVKNGIGQLELQQLKATPLELYEAQPWLEARLDAFKVEAINTRNLPAGELSLGSVRLVEPEWVLHLPENKKEEGKDSNPPSSPDLYPFLGGVLEKVHLESLELVDGKGRFSGLGGSTFGLALPEVNLEIEDILISEGTAFADDRIMHSRKIELNLDRLIYILPDKVYSMQLEDVRLSTTDKSLKAHNFQYMYGGNFMKIIDGPETNEVYRVLAKELQATGINYQKLFSNKGLFTEEVAANGLNVYIFKDLNKPEAGDEKPMPAAMVNSIKMPLSIDELTIVKGEITYEEMTEGAETAGLVRIQEVATNISNITNIRQEPGEQAEMKVTASGKLMGRGSFESEIIVPLFDESKKAQVRGTLDTLDITVLNRISRYNSRIAIESGTIYEVGWDFEAGADFSEGTFEVSYENLSVQLSDASSPDTTGILKDIGSFLANALVVDSNIAEEKSKEPKKVTFKQKREKERSFFHYYVQSLLAGFLEAIDVPFQ